MGGKSPAFLVMGLVVLIAAMALYLWTVMSENSLLRLESDRTRDEGRQLRSARDQLQTQLGESTMVLNDKKHYISEIDDKFLKTSGALEKQVAEVRQCMEQKNKISADFEKQKNDLKAKEDQQKALEEEKKKVETLLQEFKKLCGANNTADMLKNLCPKEAEKPPPKVVN
ncbi:protein CASC4-like isoform X2 [Amblyraja radiata]|uniref:protein CASC4-like isoform X2 n=1 Tax=Amblyraja radiata TaxID=386614 RepID=UPI001403A6C0|nr:protein CASC4-like isoform X2 [Amblyraja radiata]